MEARLSAAPTVTSTPRQRVRKRLAIDPRDSDWAEAMVFENDHANPRSFSQNPVYEEVAEKRKTFHA